MPDIDALIVELFRMRARLKGNIVRLRRNQREAATLAAAATEAQVLTLSAAIHDIDSAIKTYRKFDA